MRKLQSLFLGILITITVLLLGVRRFKRTSGMNEAKVLTIYNWGDYIDPSLITRFEKECRYKANHETFGSNEAMLTKTQQGGASYDIVIPSEYMTQKTIKEKLVLPLDHSKIKGLNNIDPQFLDLDLDPDNQYSISYPWRTLGTVYNDKFFDANQIRYWDDLWKPELKDSLVLVDGAREAIGLSLSSLGCSLNNKSTVQLTEAANKSNHLALNIKAIVVDEIRVYMISEEVSVAVTSPSEAVDMMWESEHLHYVIPLEGSNLRFDNIVMSRTVKNKESTHDFIDFVLEPENAARNAEYIDYSIPSEEAKALLPKDISSDEQFCLSDDTISHFEVYKDLGSRYLGVYNDLFLEFKMHRR